MIKLNVNAKKEKVQEMCAPAEPGRVKRKGLEEKGEKKNVNKPCVKKKSSERDRPC